MQDLAIEVRVAIDHCPLFRIEPSGFFEDGIVRSQLADIVQKGRAAKRDTIWTHDEFPGIATAGPAAQLDERDLAPISPAICRMRSAGQDLVFSHMVSRYLLRQCGESMLEVNILRMNRRRLLGSVFLSLSALGAEKAEKERFILSVNHLV